MIFLVNFFMLSIYLNFTNYMSNSIYIFNLILLFNFIKNHINILIINYFL